MLQVTRDHARRLLDEADGHAGRAILILEPVLARQDPHGLAQLFAHIDVDGSGTLEREEIAAMSKELGNDLTERELDLAMAAMDEDGSGGVDLEEFTAWCVSRPRLSRSAVAFCLSVARRSDAIRSASGCPHPLRCCLVLLAAGMKT